MKMTFLILLKFLKETESLVLHSDIKLMIPLPFLTVPLVNDSITGQDRKQSELLMIHVWRG